MRLTEDRVRALDKNGMRQRALDLFAGGYNCAETVVAAFATELALDTDVMRLATPFGAGIGGRRDLCGIMTGGAMVIGLVFGRTSPEDTHGKQESYSRAAQYYRWFKTERQLKCSEIVTGKFTGHTQVCVDLMSDAVEKLVEVLQNGST